MVKQVSPRQRLIDNRTPIAGDKKRDTVASCVNPIRTNGLFCAAALIWISFANRPPFGLAVRNDGRINPGAISTVTGFVAKRLECVRFIAALNRPETTDDPGGNPARFLFHSRTSLISTGNDAALIGQVVEI